METQKHWGQGSAELGLSCSHQGFDGDFSESWPSKTSPQLGFKATKSPAGRGVRTSGKHRAGTPAGFSFPRVFILLVSAALLSQWEGKVLFELLCWHFVLGHVFSVQLQLSPPAGL